MRLTVNFKSAARRTGRSAVRAHSEEDGDHGRTTEVCVELCNIACLSVLCLSKAWTCLNEGRGFRFETQEVMFS